MNRSQYEDDIDRETLRIVLAVIAAAVLIGWAISATLDGVFRGFGL